LYNKGNTGKVASDETRLKMSQAHFGNKSNTGKTFGLETHRKVSEASLRMWSDPEKKSRIIRAIAKGNGKGKGTLPEEMVWSILQEYNFPFSYNARSGDIVLESLCPDFVSNDGNRFIIEVFGDYWHFREPESYRRDLYAKQGYKTLILWESEIYEGPEAYIAFLIHSLIRHANPELNAV